ncbi:MAG TPA: hypothetical protein VN844_10265 [Pyrinomonadaceae bacterium]|nr:hypothetical protein [Pyrinomonadaceae bacterium]
MTDEERRRTMEFILEQQAQFAANIQRHDENFRRLEEDRIRDRPRITELEKSFKILVELCRTYDIRMDDAEFRATTLEESVRRLNLLLKKNQARLEQLEQNRSH